MVNVRFIKRIPIIPGLVYLNISKSGVSISVGRNGLSVSIGKRGIRFNAGLPGTGLSINKQISHKKIRAAKQKNTKLNLQDFKGEENGTKEER